MGCDIHIYVEALKTIDEKEQWVNIDSWALNPYFGLDSNEKQYNIRPIIWQRNYNLFALLANVRNDSNNLPISDPRGLPDDVSASVKAESDHWDSDGHSHSWLTLVELMAAQISRETVKESGYISPESAIALDGNKSLPNSWCASTSNKTWVHREWIRSNNSLDSLIENLQKLVREEFWIFDKNDNCLQVANRVRIVFWFDN